MANLSKFKYWNYTTSHTQCFVRSVCVCETSFSAEDILYNKQIGIPETFKAYLVENKMHLQDFVGNRFNILFENEAASFHHRHDIKTVLQQVGKTNRIYNAIKADNKADIISATRPLGIMHVHITAPLWRILASEDAHGLDMSEHYLKLDKNYRENGMRTPWNSKTLISFFSPSHLQRRMRLLHIFIIEYMRIQDNWSTVHHLWKHACNYKPSICRPISKTPK